MDFDIRVKVAIYQHFAATGAGPSPAEVAARVAGSPDDVVEAYGRLRAQRLLVTEADGVSIRMAPPFSGVPTQHVVIADEKRTMLFFRSEERAREWCVAHGHSLGPLVTINELWLLATTWYSTRLQANARRPPPQEMRAIFARIGLVGDFWYPLAS